MGNTEIIRAISDSQCDLEAFAIVSLLLKVQRPNHKATMYTACFIVIPHNNYNGSVRDQIDRSETVICINDKSNSIT